MRWRHWGFALRHCQLCRAGYGKLLPLAQNVTKTLGSENLKLCGICPKNCVSRKGEASNPKFEIRNSKQIQTSKKQKFLTGPFWILNFGFAGFGLFWTWH